VPCLYRKKINPVNPNNTGSESYQSISFLPFFSWIQVIDATYREKIKGNIFSKERTKSPFPPNIFNAPEYGGIFTFPLIKR
jgi:hypothetical protein